jgi:CMP/dCMP kinase
MIIAIDGPAASGKGTLGKRLAAHFGLRHLDTGLLYRAVAKTLMDAGDSCSDVAKAAAAAQSLDLPRFDETALKDRSVSEAASIVRRMSASTIASSTVSPCAANSLARRRRVR